MGAALVALGVVRGPARALRAMEERAPASASARVVRVLHLGDSHSGASALHEVMRAQLGGTSGVGWVFPWAAAPDSVRAGHTRGFRRVGLRPGARGDEPAAFGLTGQALETHAAGERAWFQATFSHLRVYLLRQPGGGRARLRIDGRVVGEADLAGASFDVQALSWNAPAAAARRVDVDAQGGAVRVLGVALESAPGLTYSPLWVNGAQAEWLLRVPQPVLTGLLRGEAPAVVVLAYGTNEACDSSFDAGAYEAGLQRVLALLRAAVPGAALVLVAPPDAGATKADPRALDAIADAQRRLARAWQTGFVDLRAAMGGGGTMARWQQAGLARGDDVHFSPEGYRELARHVSAATLERLGRTAREPAHATAQVATPPSRTPRSGSGIFLFRTSDGRFIMTDDPARVAGESGTWVGARPE